MKYKGITLIALVITIIVLLILAGITIGTLTGENGILSNTLSSKEKTEIANEKEIVEIAAVEAKRRDKFGEVTKTRLQIALDENTEKGITNVENDEEILLATFIESGRIYEVDKEANVTYLGKAEDVLNQTKIEANPASNSTPQLVQNIELTIKTPLSIKDENIILVYAWSNNES